MRAAHDLPQSLPDTSRPAHGILLSRLGAALRSFLDALRNRMVVNELKDMDEHRLADIGLTPHDVARALAQPLAADPMRLLQSARQDPLRGRRHR